MGLTLEELRIILSWGYDKYCDYDLSDFEIEVYNKIGSQVEDLEDEF